MSLTWQSSLVTGIQFSSLVLSPRAPRPQPQLWRLRPLTNPMRICCGLLILGPWVLQALPLYWCHLSFGIFQKKRFYFIFFILVLLSLIEFSCLTALAAIFVTLLILMEVAILTSFVSYVEKPCKVVHNITNCTSYTWWLTAASSLFKVMTGDWIFVKDYIPPYILFSWSII